MKIGVAGCGFVGSSIFNGIESIKPNEHQFIKYDPHLFADTDISDLKDCSLAFVCVPTPMNDKGKMDDSFIRDVLNGLKENKFNGICIIKSTTIPTVINELVNDFNDLKIITNPEFLTERTALQDFINTKWVIIGGDSNNTKMLHDFYIGLWPNAKYSLVAVDEAMMVKYMCNTWFSVKVSLMNEFFDIVKLLNMDWDNIVNAFATDDRVGHSHLSVPGPDRDRGFGGRCFPKDLNALLYIMRKFNIQRDVLEAAWSDNEVFRTNKDWLNIKWATI